MTAQDHFDVLVGINLLREGLDLPEVSLVAAVMTDSINKTLEVSDYRRQKQLDYSRQYKITPTSVTRAINYRARGMEASIIREAGGDYDVAEVSFELEDEMQQATSKLEFEKAALLRDQIMESKKGPASDQEVSAMNSKPAHHLFTSEANTEGIRHHETLGRNWKMQPCVKSCPR